MSEDPKIQAQVASLSTDMGWIKESMKIIQQEMHTLVVDLKSMFAEAKEGFLARHKEEMSYIDLRLKKLEERGRLHDKCLAALSIAVLVFFGWAAIHPESAQAVAGVARSVFVKPQ